MKLEVHQVLHELANDLMFTILKISALLYKEVDVERGSLFRCGLLIHLTHPSGVKCVLTAARFNPQRAGTELSRFNYVNIMAADALAPYVARTSAAIILTM